MIAIIQARLGSTRLPGKVLMEIQGKPLLEYLIERLLNTKAFCDAGLYQLPIIACPGSDWEQIKSAIGDRRCRVIGVDGDEMDVLYRYRSILTVNGLFDKTPDAFIRICADSPLIDPALIDWIIDQYNGTMLTNTKPRTFPAGQCIEIIPTKGFIRGVTGETDEDREHVTPWIYRHMNYTNAVNPLGDFSNVNMCVDTQADFDRIKATIEKMDRPHTDYGWREIAELMA